MLPLASGRSILTAQTSTSIGAETGSKTIAAVHSQCRLWVKSGQTIRGQNRPLSAVSPIADKRGRGWIVRYVPIATDAPQQKCYSIGDGNTHIHDIHIPVGEPPQHQ
jgi:hypothetical protein